MRPHRSLLGIRHSESLRIYRLGFLVGRPLISPLFIFRTSTVTSRNSVGAILGRFDKQLAGKSVVTKLSKVYLRGLKNVNIVGNDLYRDTIT